MEKAILAGGCFWCLDALFRQLAGVDNVRSGYCGGDPDMASYRTVCSGNSGHAECVEIVFDPAVLPYAALLEVFFAIHDPSTLNRQGHDTGSQYRSAIFTLGDDQAHTAHSIIRQLLESGAHQQIVTEVCAAGPFFLAETEHQDYYASNRQAPYCQAVIAPKESRFLQHFKTRLKV
jgi:peptide-methionine (S)-S-oxide reductase